MMGFGHEWRVTWQIDAGKVAGLVHGEAIYQDELGCYRHAARLRQQPRVYNNVRVERRVVGAWIGDNELDFEDDGTPAQLPVNVGDYL